MTGPELRAIRLGLGLTQEAFGRALGYQGPNVNIVVCNLETGRKRITPTKAALAEMLAAHGVTP